MPLQGVQYMLLLTSQSCAPETSAERQLSGLYRKVLIFSQSIFCPQASHFPSKVLECLSSDRFGWSLVLKYVFGRDGVIQGHGSTTNKTEMKNSFKFEIKFNEIVVANYTGISRTIFTRAQRPKVDAEDRFSPPGCL